MIHQIAATGTRDIKRALYALISSDSEIATIVGTRVRIQSEGREVSLKIDDRLPEITIGRVSTRTNAIHGLRNDLMQVSSWAETMAEAELLAHHIARVLNRAEQETFRSCQLESMDDSRDPSGAYAVHSTYRIVSLDQAL